MKLSQPHSVEAFPVPLRTLGAILIEAGRLSPAQAILVMQLQKQQGLRFGDAACQLGILQAEDIRFGLSRQFEHSSLASGDVSVASEVMAAFDSQHPLVEGLRDLRSQVMLRWTAQPARPRSLALVSARRGEGKSFIAANLAVLFSQLGLRTLLIDADLIHPRQHDLFRLDNRVGLSSVLGGLAGLHAAVSLEKLPGLVLLPAGPTAPNPRELLSRPLLTSLLSQAIQAFDVVLVDTPSAALPDALMIASNVGAAILVSRPNAATVAQSAALAGSLDNLFGAVVNEF
jgi:chain length determinant protein tyrosine kinase EpsG